MSIEETRRKNLIKLIDERFRGRQIDLSSEFDINQGDLSGLVKGKRPFGERKARTIERKVKLPVGWLDKDDEENATPVSIPVPILDIKASCGNGYANGDNVEISGTWHMPLNFLKSLGVSPANAEIIIANSFSMFPTIRNGAHVLINKADRSPREGSIYAINLNGEMVIKRLFRTGIHWILRSDNPDKNENPDRDLPETESTAIYGRVVWFDTSL